MDGQPEIVIDVENHDVWSNGERVELQRKIFDLLVFFVGNPNRLLTKHAILRGVWPDTHVTEGSVKDAVRQLRQALGDDPHDPKFIATERGLGYRFLGGITIADGPDADGRGHETNETARREELHGLPRQDTPRMDRSTWGFVIGVLVVASFGAGLILNSRPDFTPAVAARMPYGLPDTPSIAVMPFEALGDDPKLENMALGLSDDMTTSLARLPQVFVSARGAVIAETLQDLPPNDLAERFGVRYILRGSLKGAPDAYRLSVRLIDTVEGRYVWTRQFDLTEADLFAARDEIVLETLVDMSVVLDEGQRDRRTQDTVNLESWLASNEAYREFLKFRPETNLRARTLFQKALDTDDKRAIPHAGLAFTYFQEAWRGWTEDRETAIALGFRHAEAAIALDPNQPLAHQALGSLLIARGEVEKGIAARRKAVELAPNDFTAIGGLATFLPAFGAEAEAVTLFHRAVRLNPNPPAWVPLWYGHALHVNGDVDAAVDWLRKAAIEDPEAAHVQARLALALVDQGSVDAALMAAKRAVDLDPNMSAARIATIFPFSDERRSAWFADLLNRSGLPR